MKASIIGDDEVEIKQLISALSERNVEVSRFHRGQDVLEKAKAGETDFVFVIGSMILPDMSGFELIGEINAFWEMSRVDTMALLSDASENSIRQAFAVSPTVTWTIPFEKGELTSFLSWLERHSSVTP